MKITPKIDDARLRRKINRQIKDQPRQTQVTLGRTAEFLIGDIRKRTQSGKDANNKLFKGYSTTPYFFNVGSRGNPVYRTFDKGYKEFRRYKGRQVNKVDLNFSGNMLSNLTQKANSKSAIIYFASIKENIKAVGNQVKNKREFFKIGDRGKKLINFFAKEFKKVSNLI
jgi:hypothetical protein